VQLSAVFFSVSRSDVYASRPHRPAELHVMRMIPHGERSPQIDAVLGGGLMEKMRVGLDAPAPVRPLVRAHVDRRDGYVVCGEVRDDTGVHAVHILQGDQTPGHPRLVRDKKEQKMLLEPLQRLNGIRIERHLRSLAQVPPILNECSIPIQKDRGAKLTDL